MFKKLGGLVITISFTVILNVSAHASPTCVTGETPFTLKGDTAVWTMSAAPGWNCIQGLRWSYMQIYMVSVLKPPTKGKIVMVGPGFRYFADAKDYDADSFTLEIIGKNKRDPGTSTLEIDIKPPVDAVVSALSGGNGEHAAGSRDAGLAQYQNSRWSLIGMLWSKRVCGPEKFAHFARQYHPTA